MSLNISKDGAPHLIDVGYQTLLSTDSPIPHDLVIEVGGQRVYGHSQILAMASTYLRTYLYGPLSPAVTDNDGMTVVTEEDFSVAAIQNMIRFIYSFVDHSKFTLFDNQSEVTDQDEIKVALETYRASDFYHIPGLMSLCGEAVGRIKVMRTNFHWLESFLRPGILEERLSENVVLVKKYVEELDKRRSGEKSQLNHELKDKSDEWIEHEISCSECSEVELTGAGSYQDGIYQKTGSYNGRPTYVMESGWRIDWKTAKVSLLYYTGTHWLVVNRSRENEFSRLYLYLNLNECSYKVKFEDITSFHKGPPVYSASVNGISLKCGARPICQSVKVTGDADLEGSYIAQNRYESGVKVFKQETACKELSKEIWNTSLGFAIEHTVYSDKHYDGPKKMCPCQASNWNIGERLQVTCSADNCLCQYHK